VAGDTAATNVRAFGKGPRLIARAARDEPRIFLLSVGGALLAAVLTVASAYVIGAIVASVVVPAVRDRRVDVVALAVAAMVLVAFSVVKVVGIFGRRLGSAYLQLRMQARYRRRVTSRYLDLPPSWHQSHPTGQLLSTASSDVETAWLPTATVAYASATFVMLVVSLGSLFWTDWALGLVGVVFFPTLFGAYALYSRRISPRYARVQALRGEMSAVAHESFDGALVVKTMGREEHETARFTARAVELRDSLIVVGRVRGVYDPIIQAIPALGMLGALLVGVHRVDAGAIGVSGLVSATYLFALMDARAIGWFLTALPRAVFAWERLEEVIDAPGEMGFGDVDLPASAEPPAVELEFHDVTFGYGPDAPDLRDVRFRVPPGAVVALVGPTGSGKSTIASLAARLLDPDSGRIEVDGVDIRSLTAASLAATVAFVPQVPFVFDDSVRGNVLLDRPGIDDGRLDWALRAAQADGFTAHLPDGADTMVGERGTTLSGGQRQRLTLARALAGRPRLLVLDDATSAVDPKVEAAMLRDLLGHDPTGARSRSILVVAHRPATIAIADLVVYVTRGRVAAVGTHADLMAADPGYAELVTAYDRAEAERALARAYAGDNA
jgi:ABC-type multidrug transport system fused ATPase/permease subunit